MKESLSRKLRRIQSISLKWKLLIPFVFFSFLGTSVLVYISLTSQHELIKAEEIRELDRMYRVFLSVVNQKGRQALSMASIIADNPAVQELMVGRDRQGLLTYTLPLYENLKANFGIRQLHFHVLPGISFLRVHAPDRSGDAIAHRKGIREALHQGQGVVVLEWGLTGLGMRGVVPILHGQELVGSIEIGCPMNGSFLSDLKRNWGPDFTVYERDPEMEGLTFSSSTRKDPRPLEREIVEQAMIAPVKLIAPSRYPDEAFLAGPILDATGETVALIQISMDRSDIVTRLNRTRNIMVCVGLIGMCISFALIWVVAVLFIRPIRSIVKRAREIADGKRVVHLPPGPDDEIGTLTRSLNAMLNTLLHREIQIEQYARTLERRVDERTEDLISSEEKYRTLVDNLPLIVYRVLADGTTEFINPYFTQTLGYLPEDVVGDKQFWKERIWGLDNGESSRLLQGLASGSDDFMVERKVESKDGQWLTLMDHAIPFRNEQDHFQWLDGIMVDITDLKRLQDEAVRTEETRVLGEISARFAHEMRNPLVTAGGFARRVRDSLPEDSPYRKQANIIVNEVARLEQILKIILKTIEPISLTIMPVHINDILQSCIQELLPLMESRAVRLEHSLRPSLPAIPGDHALLKKAFFSLLKHGVISSPGGDGISVFSFQEYDRQVVVLQHKWLGVSQDDLDQFFYPHYSGSAESAILDLPLSRIIIHRHGGRVHIFKADERVVLRIELLTGSTPLLESKQNAKILRPQAPHCLLPETGNGSEPGGRAPEMKRNDPKETPRNETGEQ